MIASSISFTQIFILIGRSDTLAFIIMACHFRLLISLLDHSILASWNLSWDYNFFLHLQCVHFITLLELWTINNLKLALDKSILCWKYSSDVLEHLVAMICSLRFSRFFNSSVETAVFVSFASYPVFPKTMKAGVLLHLPFFLLYHSSCVSSLLIASPSLVGILASNKIVFVNIVYFHINKNIKHKSSSSAGPTRTSEY